MNRNEDFSTGGDMVICTKRETTTTSKATKSATSISVQSLGVLRKQQEREIINYFNSLKDEQSCYLTVLISLARVLRRRNRQKEAEAHFRTCSLFYKIRVEQMALVEE